MKKDNLKNNLRRFPRLPKEATVGLSQLSYPLKPEAKELGRSMNICPIGISFRSPSLFTPKTILSLSIHLPGWQNHKQNLSFKLDDASIGKPLVVLAEVVWSHPSNDGTDFESGVKFIDIDEDDYQSFKASLGL